MEALLESLRPILSRIATGIPRGDSPLGGLRYTEERGIWLAERGPLGTDGGGYLYVLVDGTLAELKQWPTSVEGSEGWIGQLRPLKVGSALGRFPRVRPSALSRIVSQAITNRKKAESQPSE